MSMPLSANGGTGTAGQLLYSNGVTGSPYWAAAPANYTISTGLVNTTGTITVNASYIATIAANNASYLGGVAASGYQTTAGLSANIATLTSNNSSYLGGTAAASYALLSGATFTGTVATGDGTTLNLGRETTGGLEGAQINWASGNSSNASYPSWSTDIYAAVFRILNAGASNTNVQISGTSTGTVGLFVQGNTGIGTTSPAVKLHISGDALRIDGTSGEAGPYLYRAGGNAPDIRFFTSNGTIASPTTVANGSNLGQIHFQGYDGTAYRDLAGVWAQVDGAVSTNNVPSALKFLTGSTSQTENMRISSNGNVGVGTTTPSVKLHVTGNSYISGGLSVGTTSFNRKVNFANGEMTFIPYTAAEGASTNTYFINVSDASGNYGNSMTLNFRALYSSGAASGTLAAITMNTTLLGVTGDVYTAYSDERLKDIIGPIDNALSKVQSLTGFYYQPNKTAISLGIEKNQLSRVGVSAQKVKEVLPEAVGPAPINDMYLTVQYEKIVPLLIEAIKELSIKIEKLEQRIG
jgi:hypothetical protein